MNFIRVNNTVLINCNLVRGVKFYENKPDQNTFIKIVDTEKMSDGNTLRSQRF